MTTYYDNHIMRIFLLHFIFYTNNQFVKNKTNDASKAEEIKLFKRILNFIKNFMCRSLFTPWIYISLNTMTTSIKYLLKFTSRFFYNGRGQHCVFQHCFNFFHNFY